MVGPPFFQVWIACLASAISVKSWLLSPTWIGTRIQSYTGLGDWYGLVGWPGNSAKSHFSKPIHNMRKTLFEIFWDIKYSQLRWIKSQSKGVDSRRQRAACWMACLAYTKASAYKGSPDLCSRGTSPERFCLPTSPPYELQPLQENWNTQSITEHHQTPFQHHFGFSSLSAFPAHQFPHFFGLRFSLLEKCFMSHLWAGWSQCLRRIYHRPQNRTRVCAG